jgi:nucleoside-diphosphate-sugar epimerase
MRGEVMMIVVIGGTGLIGSKVVEKLKKKGHEAIAAAPNTGVDTITGEGLKEGGRRAYRPRQFALI